MHAQKLESPKQQRQGAVSNKDKVLSISIWHSKRGSRKVQRLRRLESEKDWLGRSKQLRIIMYVNYY